MNGLAESLNVWSVGAFQQLGRCWLSCSVAANRISVVERDLQDQLVDTGIKVCYSLPGMPFSRAFSRAGKLCSVSASAESGALCTAEKIKKGMENYPSWNLNLLAS